jgi:hypothetical protein
LLDIELLTQFFVLKTLSDVFMEEQSVEESSFLIRSKNHVSRYLC